MEACAARDGPDVVYALGKPIKQQEKTRVSTGMGERPAGGRARASKFVTPCENLDSCAQIRSDMGASGEF